MAGTKAPDVRGDSGVVAVLTALTMVALLVGVAFAVDIGRWYMEGERLQRTVDAAALAGVPYLPGDLPRARTEARKLIAANGYDSSTSAVPDTNIIPSATRPSQLRVTMSSTIPNIFGPIIGRNQQGQSRTATADYAAAAAMGSPCNVMGNEPPDAGGATVASAACPPTPNFWENIAGPEAPKGNGDRYTTRSCGSGNSNCSGSTNIDYYGSGGAGVQGQSYYIYKITPRSTLASMTIQLYDPMFVDVGDYCQTNLTQTANGLWNTGVDPNRPNPFVTDATTRYAWGIATGTDAGKGQVGNTPAPTWSGRFCTGDIRFGGTASDLNTTFALLNPTPTLDPLSSTVAGSCKRSFGGFSGNLNRALLATDGAYNATVAQNFRQWVSLCTVSNPQVGKDYYLLVRTNVPSNPSDARVINPDEDASTDGNGHNRYGIRVTGGSAVSISALERMPIYANLKSGTTDFYLARVTSANAGARMTVTFFDTGDADGAATIALKDPSGSAPSGCKATGEVRTSPTGDFNATTCTLSNVQNSNGYNGKIQRIEVPIPDTYTCVDSDPLACWYRLKFTYPTGVTANDTTTWSASLDGDPVRLVK